MLSVEDRLELIRLRNLLSEQEAVIDFSLPFAKLVGKIKQLGVQGSLLSLDVLELPLPPFVQIFSVQPEVVHFRQHTVLNHNLGLELRQPLGKLLDFKL